MSAKTIIYCLKLLHESGGLGWRGEVSLVELLSLGGEISVISVTFSPGIEEISEISKGRAYRIGDL